VYEREEEVKNKCIYLILGLILRVVKIRVVDEVGILLT
jgi:hypothetical protein